MSFEKYPSDRLPSVTAGRRSRYLDLYKNELVLTGHRALTTSLTQNVPQHGSVHIRETPFDSVVVEAQAFVVQSKQMQNGRMQIVDRGHTLFRLITKIVRRAITKAAFDAGARHPNGKSFRVVITAAGILLKSRHPPELRGP